jgi:hypothetical protein
MGVVSFTPRPLYPRGKSPWYPLDRWLGGPQSRSELGGEEKISQPLPGLEPPIIQPVAQSYTTELRECIQKFPDWPPGARTANDTTLCHYAQLYRYFVSQSSEFCRHNPLCYFSTSNTKGKRVFRSDSVRKLLDTPSYPDPTKLTNSIEQSP